MWILKRRATRSFCRQSRDRLTMRWTAELDALLNQCVFECGYDFTAGAELLLRRARQLRLVSGDAQIVLTSDECQVRWMEINPVVEDDDEDGESAGRAFHDDDFHFYRHDESLAPTTEIEATPEIVELPEQVVHDEVRPVEPTGTEIPEPTATVDVPDGCPRLELSLSDADLDALLNSLPTANDEDNESAADAKHGEPSRGGSGSSEMQWVLSFLSNPDEAAHQDAEAKNMLFETGDRSEDDNFQYFLQQLDRANLMSPEKPMSSSAGAATVSASKSSGDHLETTSEEDDTDDDDEGWMEARKQIKTHGPSRTDTRQTASATGAALSHKRRLKPKASHSDEILPPAAPIRLPPRDEFLRDDDDAASNESDDNGLDALPRYEASPSAKWTSHAPSRRVASPAVPSSSKLLALSQEIGQQLRQHGEFQFPKRLFGDPDNTRSIDEQVPEDEP